MEGGQKISAEDLLQLKGSDRQAKAYAFLYAAFKRTEVSANPVRDALDCFVHFIAPYTNSIAGNQVTSTNVQAYLKDKIGFDIPLYAIDQLIVTLRQHGFVEYRNSVKAYFAVTQENGFDVAKVEIETDFDEISGKLGKYAKSVGYEIDPPSGSWGDALIRFLRAQSDQPVAKIAKVKNVLLDPVKIEASVVGAFIHKLHRESEEQFQKILKVFMGVIIEDFISEISEIGSLSLEKPVSVYYDTALLLRQLGCSGRALGTATEELTRYLQDLGANIYYLSGNEAEVAGIIDTIVFIKDTGKELEGETAAAIASGEVSTSDLRLLQNGFVERLAAFNIFPAGEIEKDIQASARHQIDEKGFGEYLKAAARKNGRAYSQQNSQNDATYLGAIMRLRKGSRPRDLADCGHVFVTSNRLLATASRRFLLEQRAIVPVTFPPMVSVGQMATIAWLLKDHSIPPEKAGRELLSNCFAAIRPDAEWFGFFREGMEKVTGPLEDYNKQNVHALTLQAARRIAQEESFGSSAIVKQLNMAEILSRAEQEQQKAESQRIAADLSARQQHEEEKRKLQQEATEELERTKSAAVTAQSEAVRMAAEQARADTLEQVRLKNVETGVRRAGVAIALVRGVFVMLLAAAICTSSYLSIAGASGSTVAIYVSIALVPPNILAFADLLGLPWVRNALDQLRAHLAVRLRPSSD